MRAMASRLIGAGLAVLSGSAAFAASPGIPEPWQITMQTPVTQVARDLHDFHTLLMWLITIITLFVAGLLAYCMVKFNEKANPVPSRTAHNTMIEIAWTVVPVLILIIIAIPSFRLLRNQLIIPEADVTVKATGHSWYWEYSYPGDKEGKGAFTFDSRIISDPSDQAKALPGKDGSPRLLAVDNEMVVPVNKVVRVQVTADIVSHAFAMPSFGIKIDAMPGRMNETWFKAEREGVYHGQCSELCGQFHAYMPITIRVVGDAEYATWLAEAQQKFASDQSSGGPTRLADAAAK
jgi:cytochrome c oxidase subunit 2